MVVPVALADTAGNGTKGERTRRRIMAETQAMIEDVGIAAISQEAVARRVGITQSALRHHFPTRESLFDAIFDRVFSGFYRSAEKVLLEPGKAPRERLMALCALHLDYVVAESDRVALESFAYHLGNPGLLSRQSHWYHWIVGHYAALLGAFRPELDDHARQDRALAILTLCVGAWITIGRSRPPWPAMPGTGPTSALLAVVAHLVDG